MASEERASGKQRQGWWTRHLWEQRRRALSGRGQCRVHTCGGRDRGIAGSGRYWGRAWYRVELAWMGACGGRGMHLVGSVGGGITNGALRGKKIGWAAPKLPRGPPTWKNGEQEFQTGHKTAGCCWVSAPRGLQATGH